MRLRIVNPCPVDFHAMRVDGARRFCDECNKHVYDLTCMREDEVRKLVSERGKICGRIAAAAIALTGCSAADQQSAQPTVQIGPLNAPPPPSPSPDAGVDDQPTMGEIEISN
jgi:hypothetical protein